MVGKEDSRRPTVVAFQRNTLDADREALVGGASAELRAYRTVVAYLDQIAMSLGQLADALVDLSDTHSTETASGNRQPETMAGPVVCAAPQAD
jgi:hypothetical protein